jgi:hypothetical protein
MLSYGLTDRCVVFPSDWHMQGSDSWVYMHDDYARTEPF